MAIERNTGIDWEPVDPECLDAVLDAVLERDPWYAPRVGREPMTTREQVMDYLAARPGTELHYGSDWDSTIRSTPVRRPRSAADEALSAALARNARNQERHDRGDYSHDE